MYLSKILGYINVGDFEKVVLECQVAIKESPGLFIYYEYLAQALYELGDFVSCKKAVKDGIALSSNSVVLQLIAKEIDGLGSTKDRFCGKYLFYPNQTGVKRFEGGVRLKRSSKKVGNGPLVSIVTAVYNNPDTLERCIQSVKKQTYGNIEHIIIDGGSDKNTLDIIKSYEDTIEYFVSEPDKGIYDAMNKGIELSQGDYVCLLNSDDFYEEVFVEKSLEKLSGNREISYCDYYASDNQLLKAKEINEGVFLGHLNICHNTFLVPKEVYNDIGRYDISYRIVSDAVWIRKAFREGVEFVRLEGGYFTLSDGGLSSGVTEKHRKLFIDEVVLTYLKQFPFLTMSEAEDLYLFRFNKNRINRIIDVAKKYINNFGFIKSVSRYVEYCFSNRNNFKLSHNESSGLFLKYLEAVKLLDIDVASIKITTKRGCFSSIIKEYRKVIDSKANDGTTILHFLSVFSAPSETFIYDLVNRLENLEGYNNFVMCEHEKLRTERPFSNKLYVPWNDFRPEIRNEIYKDILTKLNPDLVITHFALNEWKFQKRIKPLGFQFPTITMTHGIDVFNLKSDSEYRKYIVDEFSKRKDVIFTAVSEFLRNELISQGVPKEKVVKIHNSANSRYFNYRKESGFYDYSRTLKLLSIGRCIDWKGHIDLLYGFKKFLDSTCGDATLTIVYGNGEDNLKDVLHHLTKLSLEDNVELVPFIDFSVEKDYFSKFDIYIQASKYTNDKQRKSETFGVASLEAILAGLPVIVTNAGGLPEVAGYEGLFSRIVQHTSSDSIAAALEEFYKEPSTFTNNVAYAEDRLECFSEEKQIALLTREIEKLTQPSIKVAMFSTSTIQGAGYAAFRLFRGLRDSSSIQPTLFTTVRNHEKEESINVVRHPGGDGKLWNLNQDSSNSKPGLTIFTINDHSISNSQLWEWVKNSDVINIHWTARFLSVENIAFLSNLDKPLVITVRDMQHITGGCHYFHGCQKWLDDCGSCPQLYDTYGDLPRKILAYKRNHYNFDNITLVALSNHTKSILERVPLFKDCRIEVIPNSIETEVFKPYDKLQARELLGLPYDRKIIGYVPSFSSEVKGYREVIEAFNIVKNSCEEQPLVMLVGNETPADEAICLDKISLGYIDDNSKLALAYSAADVVVVPSLEETFSNTTAESISCGTPVVGFKTGAIPDLAINNISGLCYEVGDIEGLAEGLIFHLNNKFNVELCRDYAVSKLDFSIQADRYELIFKSL